jgi:hypothetical protein
MRTNAGPLPDRRILTSVSGETASMRAVCIWLGGSGVVRRMPSWSCLFIARGSHDSWGFSGEVWGSFCAWSGAEKIFYGGAESGCDLSDLVPPDWVAFARFEERFAVDAEIRGSAFQGKAVLGLVLFYGAAYAGANYCGPCLLISTVESFCVSVHEHSRFVNGSAKDM